MTKQKSSKRGGWDSWFEFLFSALGSMVGLGNIWRFPYVCYRSGGGAFLIPFFVSMLGCGCPLILLETVYCQYSNLGPGKVWVICPLFKGIGFGMITITFVVSIYYTMIMAWTLYYVVASFRPTLPWDQCMPGLSSPDCLSIERDNFSFFSNVSSMSMWNESTMLTGDTQTAGINFTSFNFTGVGEDDNITSTLYKSKEEAFWFQNVLNISEGLDDMGTIQWHLVICLVVTWILVFLCLIRGIKSMGKVVYVAATAPYLILTCLLIRGCLLPGASKGIYFYLVPDWEKLLNLQVWRSAATQVFFSMGMGFGLISTLASYNKFNNNCHRDALILPVLDCGTSVFAGVVIFTFLGYMAHITGKSVDQVAQEGPGLVFVAYPAVLSTLPLPQLWSTLFFAMLFCVGLDSQFMHVQAVCTALADCFPEHLRSRKTLLTLSVCILSFFLGLPLTTQGGFYLLNLMDWYIASFSVMLIVLMEVVVLAWIYGVERLYADMRAMIGFKPFPIWSFLWRYFMPVFILVLWVSGIINYKSIGDENPGYPAWSDVLGLAIGLLPLVPIPIKMAWTLYKTKGSLRQRLSYSTRPSSKWRAAKDMDIDECTSGEERIALNNGHE